ncbi:MAG: P-II family nitrogen regulator [Firmicutes bacterium]|nr:P-II family nitrogen regulator [Bacillota bacterium]
MNQVPQNGVLIAVIVNKGMGSKVARAAAQKGSVYNTILNGKGTANKRILSLFGLDSLDREVVLSLSTPGQEDDIVAGILSTTGLQEPGHGILFRLPLKVLLAPKKSVPTEAVRSNLKEGSSEEMDNPVPFELIVTIVDRGLAEDVVAASKAAGAQGGTIIHGRGTGTHHETQTFLGISIEPEKDIVLTLIPQDKTKAVLDAIVKELSLDKPGKGIAFVLSVEKTVGLVHGQKGKS